MAIFDPFGGYTTSQNDTTPGAPSPKAFDPFGGYVAPKKKTKQEIADEEARKQLQVFKDAEKAKANAPKPKNLIDLAGDAAGAVGNFVKDSAVSVYNAGKNTVDNVGSVIDSTVKQNEYTGRIAATQNQQKFLNEQVAAGKLSQEEATKQSNANMAKLNASAKKSNDAVKKTSAIDPKQAALDAADTALNVGTLGLGSIPKALAKQAAKRAGIAIAEQAVKGGVKALAGNVVKEGAVGATYGASNSIRTDANAQDTTKNIVTGAIIGGAVPVAGKVVGKAAQGVGKALGKGRGAELAAKEAQQAAEDAAARKAAGIVDTPPTPTESLTTPPTTGNIATDGTPMGAMPKTVEARKNQGFMQGDIQANGQSTNRVGQAVNDVVTPEGLAADTGAAPSRYVSKTLPNSEFVDAGTKKNLGATYDQTNNAVRGDTTLKQLDAEGIDNFSTKVHSRLDDKHITDQTVFDAQGAAQALEARGTEADLQKAAEIYNKLSTHLSKAGQTVQAAAIMARQTPQGLSYYAQKQFKNAGVEFGSKLQQELKAHIDAVKSAAPQSEEMALARDNVQYFIAKNIPSNKSDQLINFWRAGLLTSPTTTAGALVGNAAQTLNRKLIENPVAAMADMVQSMFTGKRTSALAKTGELAKGSVTGAKNAANGQYWKTGYDPMTIADKSGKYDQPTRMINYGQGALGKTVGGYVNGVYKVMGAADQPFRYGAQRESLSSLANSEIKNQKLKGADAKAFYDDFMANPPKDALNTATKEAKYQTFQNDTHLGSIISGVKNNLRAKGMNKTAAMVDFFVPFNNVPAAVATRLVTNTPIGTAHTLVENILKVRKGEKWDQRAVSKAIGQGMSGLPVLAAGIALGKSGLVTGGYPATQAERDQWQAEGKQPNSVKIGDRWYSLNYIQPFASLLATGAKISEAEQSGLKPGEIFSQALASAGNSLLSQSFLQGVQGAIDAVKNPSEFAGRYVANTAAGVIPNFIRAGVRAADPLQRDISGFQQGIMSGIPGVRDSLPVKTNADGEALQSKDNFVNQYLNPLKPSQVKDSANTAFNNEAILPASRLKSVRQKEINSLLADGSVQAAQRKIEEYNQQVTEVLAPYVNKNQDNISTDQLDKIHSMYLGQVWINKKGRPTISDRKNLPS